MQSIFFPVGSATWRRGGHLCLSAFLSACIFCLYPSLFLSMPDQPCVDSRRYSLSLFFEEESNAAHTNKTRVNYTRNIVDLPVPP